jgi:hypothetical protein
MTIDSTPLLAGDGPPSLSAGNHSLDDDGESPLAQLMRKKEPQESLFDDVRLASELASSNSTNQVLSEPLLSSPHRAVSEIQEKLNHESVSYFSLIGGSLILLEWGCLWASFLSCSWASLHLAVTVDWQERFLPGLDDLTDTVLQSFSLTEIIQLANSLESKTILFVVGVTSLLVPCCSMILQPLAIIEAHQVFFGNIPLILHERWFDLLLRAGFFVFYLLLILDITVTGVQLHFTETVIRLYNEIQLGLTSYVLGLMAASGVAIVLRWGQPATSHVSNRSSWIHQSFVFESALLAVILMAMTLVTPLFRIEYHGIGVEFMKEREIVVHFKDLVSILSSQKSQSLMRQLCGGFLLTQVLILPILLWAFTVAYWCGIKSMKSILRVLHVIVNPLIFALSLLVVLPQLEGISRILFDEQTSVLCSRFTDLLEDDCLRVSGKAHWGSWALLGHAISLEVFVLLSIA